MSKGMSNIYLEVTIEKNSQNVDFLSLRNLPLRHFLESFISRSIIEF